MTGIHRASAESSVPPMAVGHAPTGGCGPGVTEWDELLSQGGPHGYRITQNTLGGAWP